LGPEVIARGHIDELRSDAEALAGSAHAALDQIADLERVTDRAGAEALALERERRRARCNPKLGHFRKRTDELLGHSIREVIGLRLGAQIHEWEHGDGVRDGPRNNR